MIKKFLILSFILPILASSVALADFNFPYSNIRLNLPLYEDPIPGIGVYYGSLAKGMSTAFWNPAGLTKIPTVEANAMIPFGSLSSSFSQNFKIEDNEFDAGSGFTNGIYFTDNMSDLTKQDRTATSTLGYNNPGATLNFDQAIKFNDWLAIGVKTLNPLEASWDIAGGIPVTSKYSSDLNNFSQDNLSITDGKLTYSVGGTDYTTSDKV
ncbi:MAG: hypothetical protein WC527_07385, partial [Candidatus Margulisiibacteriota bacterium]